MIDYTLHAKAILALDAGHKTAPAVAKALRVCERYAGTLLHRLADEGLAHRTREARQVSGGCTPAEWALK